MVKRVIIILVLYWDCLVMVNRFVNAELLVHPSNLQRNKVMEINPAAVSIKAVPTIQHLDTLVKQISWSQITETPRSFPPRKAIKDAACPVQVVLQRPRDTWDPHLGKEISTAAWKICLGNDNILLHVDDLGEADSRNQKCGTTHKGIVDRTLNLNFRCSPC